MQGASTRAGHRREFFSLTQLNTWRPERLLATGSEPRSWFAALSDGERWSFSSVPDAGLSASPSMVDPSRGAPIDYFAYDS
jgi:hypothetical protein